MSANSNQEDTIWEIGLGMMCKVDIEHFLRQHFVGKQFAHDPDAPDHYAVFTDGTAVYAHDRFVQLGEDSQLLGCRSERASGERGHDCWRCGRLGAPERVLQLDAHSVQCGS